FVACEKKVDPLPNYLPGTAVTLTASPTTITPAVADSDKVGLTLSWTNPNYSVDSSTVKYVIDIDSSGRNFAKAVSTV
ncbi:SusE domain-containing protein, partial [Acinetobacter baumannii]